MTSLAFAPNCRREYSRAGYICSLGTAPRRRRMQGTTLASMGGRPPRRTSECQPVWAALVANTCGETCLRPGLGLPPSPQKETSQHNDLVMRYAFLNKCDGFDNGGRDRPKVWTQMRPRPRPMSKPPGGANSCQGRNQASAGKKSLSGYTTSPPRGAKRSTSTSRATWHKGCGP